MIRELNFDNGLQIIYRNDPNQLALSIGLFVAAGIAEETERTNGIAHFLEHMVFKGTPSRSAKQIAKEMDLLGGRMNAMTSKEYTSYYITVLPDDLAQAVDLLTDIYLNPNMDPKEVELERKVIGEEIRMYDDTPDEWIHDHFAQVIWNKSPLGNPILGTMETLGAITATDLREFHGMYNDQRRLIISIAGNIPNEAALIDTLTAKFSKKTKKITIPPLLAAPQPSQGISITHKATEQVHFCMGVQAVAYDNPDKYALGVLNTIFGSGMSSRLFQKVREEKGYAYSVYSYLSTYRQTGLFTVYGGVNPNTLDKALHVIGAEWEKLLSKPIPESELKKAKSQMKSQMLMSLERPSSWMGWMARNLYYNKHYVPLDEIVANMEAVTRDDLSRVANAYLQLDKIAFAAVGPISQQQSERYQTGIAKILKK